MDHVAWSTDLMHETARIIGTENENLLNEHMQRWQQIHDINAALPTSMQETFRTFHTSLETNLSGALTLHKHIGQTLAASADLAESADTAIVQAFNKI